MVVMNAARPDQRWKRLTQDGEREPSLPYMLRADSTWQMASSAASVVSQALAAIAVWKPATLIAMPCASWKRANRPIDSDTSAAMTTATSRRAGGVGAGAAGATTSTVSVISPFL